MPPATAVARAYWPHPAGPPTLAPEALHRAQADTLATPRRRYDPFSRLMFLTVNVLYDTARTNQTHTGLDSSSRRAA